MQRQLFLAGHALHDDGRYGESRRRWPGQGLVDRLVGEEYERVMETELLIIGCLCLGTLCRTTFGFGDAAVAMPLLALLSVAPSTAIPLVGLVGATVAAFVALSEREAIDLGAVKQLGLATAVGIPFGVLMAAHAPEAVVITTLGVLLVAYGAYAAVRPSARALPHRAWAHVFGFFSGCLGSAYNLNGLPIAVYGNLRGWDPPRFRSTIQTHFVISSAMVLVGHAVGGLWTTSVWYLYGLSVPPLLLAAVLGHFVGRRFFDAETFATAVGALIAVLGVLLLV